MGIQKLMVDKLVGFSLDWNIMASVCLFVQAQAIMLTASIGNYSNYPPTNVQNGCRWQTELKKSLPVMSYRSYRGSTTNLMIPSCTQVRLSQPIHRSHNLQIAPPFFKLCLEILIDVFLH